MYNIDINPIFANRVNYIISSGKCKQNPNVQGTEKMKLAAIICEFDPLHTGHKRLIDYAKTIADKVACIMSGNFTQRALPACADKFARARHAIWAGADIVVELPTVFATASAENFAFGGVTVANKLGADYLVFGSECGNITQLQQCLELMEREETQKKIKAAMKDGVSYPKALSVATGMDLLSKPNNTLAIEYLRALSTTKSNIVPITIKREDNFNGAEPQQFASSSMLRIDKNLRSKFSFDFVTKDINDEIEQKYRAFIPTALALATKEKLAEIEGVTEGLENRIVKADKTQGFELMTEQIKTKRYTRLKIQRIYLNYLLGIDKHTISHCKQSFPPIKVLAVQSDCAQLVSKVDDKIDAITLLADNFYYSLAGTKPPLKLPVYFN